MIHLVTIHLNITQKGNFILYKERVFEAGWLRPHKRLRLPGSILKSVRGCWLRPHKCPRLPGSILKSVQGCLAASSKCPRLPGSIRALNLCTLCMAVPLFWKTFCRIFPVQCTLSKNKPDKVLTDYGH